MSSIQRYLPSARYSEAVICNGLIWLSGQVPAAGKTIETQTMDVLQQIGQLLQENGSSPSHLLSATIYLRSLDDYAGMNAVWDAWLPEGCAPARTTVQASLASADWRIEITVVAAVATE